MGPRKLYKPCDHTLRTAAAMTSNFMLKIKIVSVAMPKCDLGSKMEFGFSFSKSDARSQLG